MSRWNEIPPAEKERLAAMSTYELHVTAVIMGMNPKTLLNRVCEYRQTRAAVLSQISTPDAIPASPTPDYSDYFVLDGDDFMILGDVEVPDHDATILQRALDLGAKHNLSRLIIAGDFVAADQFSTWPSLYARTGDLNFADSLKLAKDIIRALKRQYSEIYFISGNHDQRINRQTNGQINLGMFLEEIEGVHFSQYAYMYLYTSRGPVYVCHPHGGGKPLAVAERYYNRVTAPNGEKCHIVLPHFHAEAATWSADGLRELRVLPCARDGVKTQYKRLSANGFRAWSYGMLMLKRGYFYPYSKHGTDWKVALGE